MKTLRRFVVLAGLVWCVPSAAAAQHYQTVYLPGYDSRPDPVPQTVTDPKADPDDIAFASERELNGDGYFVKSGATLDQYHQDWQTCHLISQGSSISFAGGTYVYNAGTVSPLAAGIGAGLGAALGSAMAEEAVQANNRKRCLLIKGWQLIRPSTNLGARITTVKPERRAVFLNWLVGQAAPEGRVRARWEDRIAPPDPALGLDLPARADAAVYLEKPLEGATLSTPGENDALIVLAFRKPTDAIKPEHAKLTLRRYDPELRDLVFPKPDEKSDGRKTDKAVSYQTTYSVQIELEKTSSLYEVHVARITPGFYVIDGLSEWETNCFGAPLIEVQAASVTYAGDWVPIDSVRLSTGEKVENTLALSSHMDETRAALTRTNPAVAEAMAPMKISNGASYSCAGHEYGRLVLYGVPNIGETGPPEAH